MLPTVPNCEPIEIVGGDTVQWTKSLANFSPGDGWTLKYRLIGGGLDVTIVADIVTLPGTYLLTFPAANTATVVNADGVVARLIGWVEDAGVQKLTVYDQVITVLPNARTATASDLLLHEEKVLAAIEAVLEGRAVTDIAQYAIGGREVQRMGPGELLQWAGVYRARIWRKRNPGQSFPTHAARMRAAR